MLVLTRKKGERIRIGEDIEIVLVDIQGDQVRIGVEAPRHVKIYRQEIFSAIREENRSALTQVAEIQDMFQKIKKNEDNGEQ